MKAAALLATGAALAFSRDAGAQVYIEAQVGYSSADFSLNEPFNGVVDDNSIAYGLNLGVGFAPRWAAEVSWRGYGNFDGLATPCAAGSVCTLAVNKVSGIDVNVVALSVVPRFEIGNVQAFAKAGWYRASIDTDIGLPDDDFRENGLVVGAGLRWYFDEPWSVSLEATRHDDNLYQITVGFGWGLRLLASAS